MVEESWSRRPEGIPGRSEVYGFAERTRKNLDYILQAHQTKQDVHVVTQLVLSLLGLVVFPFERSDAGDIHEIALAHFGARGWPSWTISPVHVLL